MSLVHPNLNITFTPKKIKLGILASGEGSNFEAIVLACQNGILNASVCLLIVNKPNCNAIIRAEKLGIECLVLDHNNYSSREEHEKDIVHHFNNHCIDLIVMAGWMRVVTPLLISSFPQRILNIHPSLLPSFKGVASIERAYKEKVKITGCTVHIVDQKVDSGEIIIQSAVVVNDYDDLEDLRSRIQKEEHKILPIAISIIASRNYRTKIKGK